MNCVGEGSNVPTWSLKERWTTVPIETRLFTNVPLCHAQRVALPAVWVQDQHLRVLWDHARKAAGRSQGLSALGVTVASPLKGWVDVNGSATAG